MPALLGAAGDADHAGAALLCQLAGDGTDGAPGGGHDNRLTGLRIAQSRYR